MLYFDSSQSFGRRTSGPFPGNREREWGLCNDGFSLGNLGGGEDSEFTVPGTRGWYALIRDPDKGLLNRAYLVKFIQ